VEHNSAITRRTAPPFSRYLLASQNPQTCAASFDRTLRPQLLSLCSASDPILLHTKNAVLGWVWATEGKGNSGDGLFILQCGSTAISVFWSASNTWPEQYTATWRLQQTSTIASTYKRGPTQPLSYLRHGCCLCGISAELPLRSYLVRHATSEQPLTITNEVTPERLDYIDTRWKWKWKWPAANCS
jgi:hypothetical protein